MLIRLLAIGLFAVLVQSARASDAQSADGAQIALRIMQTTDLHMNLLNYDYYQDQEVDTFGLAKTVSLLKTARAERPNTLFFDNGDLLQGNPLGEFVAKVKPFKAGTTHPAFKVMNTLGYDAANIGNHDFNFGLAYLRRAIDTANFPYVNANMYLDTPARNEHAFAPYVILERHFSDSGGKKHTLKIGVLGLAPPQIMQWDRNHLLGKLYARDMLEVAKQYVPEIRAKGADLVIVIAHSGFEKRAPTPFAENAVAQLAEIPGVDAILFGHAHAEFPSAAFAGYPKVDISRGSINGVPAVMPGRWGDHLGVIDLTLQKRPLASLEAKLKKPTPWTVTASQSSIRPIFDAVAKKPLVAADPAVGQLIAAEHAATLAYVRGKLAVSSAPIYSYFAQVIDDASVQVVANAQIAFMKKAIAGTDYANYPVLSAAAPFKTGGRQGSSYYTDIPQGRLAIKNAADLYIYPNTLKGIFLTGAQVRDWIEMSAGQFNKIDPNGSAEQPLVNPEFASFNFDTIDGVTYELDLTQPAKYDATGALAKNMTAAQSSRVTNLRFAGKKIDFAQKFIVASNNYRAFGGGNFPGLSAEKVVIDAPQENREALVQYLLSHPKFDPSADANWHIRAIRGVRLTFVSASTAAKYLPRHRNISRLKDNADGTSTYVLRGGS